MNSKKSFCNLIVHTLVYEMRSLLDFVRNKFADSFDKKNCLEKIYLLSRTPLVFTIFFFGYPKEENRSLSRKPNICNTGCPPHSSIHEL